MLEKCIHKSLWSRFFDDKIDDIKNQFNTIREFRNKVSHNKEFYEKEYNSFYNMVKPVIYKMKSAKDDIDMKEINSQIIKDSYSAYNEIKFDDVMKQLDEQSKKMQEVLANIGVENKRCRIRIY